MTYQDLPPIGHHEFDRALASNSTEEAAQAVLRMSLHEPDFEWAQQNCLLALADPRPEVRAAAITAAGHLARIHRAPLDSAIVEELRKLHLDSRFSGLAEDALDDIQMFAPSPTGAS